MKPTENEVSQNQKRVAETLIKPVENEDFFSQNRKNGIENDQKSITFIDESDMTFRHVEKPYKTNEKLGFSKVKNALQKP